MKIINASAAIEAFTPNMEQVIEAAGRTCWKSEDKICDGSAEQLINKVKNFKHESVLEHASITVRFIVDRGVSHELVRHRHCSFSQESTRYCNYGKGKFGGEVTFIDIRGGFPEIDEIEYMQWEAGMQTAEQCYLAMLAHGASAQLARSILPNSTKTEVVMTTNPRDWRHIFHLRCDRAAHPQMREVMLPLWKEFAGRWPVLFNDVTFTE